MQLSNPKIIITQLYGIRGLAVILVCISHLSLQVTRLHGLDENFTYSNTIALALELCGNGVSIFFCLSAFLLSMPYFEKNKITHQPIKVNFYAFITKRLKRLHIPYIIALTILFIYHLLFTSAGFKTQLQHYIASFFYQHNLIYGYRSSINPVAWTLEIEIQFYLLFSVLIQLFNITNKYLKWWFIVIIISVFALLPSYNAAFINTGQVRYSILYYLPVFFIGFFLAYVYVYYFKLVKSKTWWADAGTLAGIYLIIYYAGSDELLYKLFEYGGYFFLFIGVFKGKLSCYFFATAFMQQIGKISYSIYLIHYAIIIFISTYIATIIPMTNFYKDIILYSFILLPIVLGVSWLYFYLFEQKFMNTKNAAAS